jgi:dienelactone hydrolase
VITGRCDGSRITRATRRHNYAVVAQAAFIPNIIGSASAGSFMLDCPVDECSEVVNTK